VFVLIHVRFLHFLYVAYTALNKLLAVFLYTIFAFTHIFVYCMGQFLCEYTILDSAENKVRWQICFRDVILRQAANCHANTRNIVRVIAIKLSYKKASTTIVNIIRNTAWSTSVPGIRFCLCLNFSRNNSKWWLSPSWIIIR